MSDVYGLCTVVCFLDMYLGAKSTTHAGMHHFTIETAKPDYTVTYPIANSPSTHIP